MILRYIDAKILPGYAAVRHQSPVGYAFFVYEGSKGVIGDLFVSRQSMDAGHLIEQHLLTHVIETLQQSPGVHRVEAQLLVHDAGSLAAPFLSRGFRRYPRVFMNLPLRQKGGSIRTLDRVPAGIEVRRWSEQDYHSVAALITAAYRGHVDSDINDQYRSLTGALRFLNNIVRFPGCGVFDAGASFVAVHSSTHTLAGVILCSRVKENVGHVTQVCMMPEYRGQGIGEALLNATALELERRRFSNLTLTVTEANAGAVRLYKRLGYAAERIFDAFVWEG